jgi:hypothetical protein
MLSRYCFMVAPRVVSPLIRTAAGRIDSVRDAFSVDAAGRIKAGPARRRAPGELDTAHVAGPERFASLTPAEIDIP